MLSARRSALQARLAKAHTIEKTSRGEFSTLFAFPSPPHPVRRGNSTGAHARADDEEPYMPIPRHPSNRIGKNAKRTHRLLPMSNKAKPRFAGRNPKRSQRSHQRIRIRAAMRPRKLSDIPGDERRSRTQVVAKVTLEEGESLLRVGRTR